MKCFFSLICRMYFPLKSFENACVRGSIIALFLKIHFTYYVYYRAIRRAENLGIPVSFGGNNLPLLVEIGLTDLPKSGGATPWARATKKVHKPPGEKG